MRKIKYKKGRKIHPSQVEYTGIYTDKETELQLFVYNEENVVEYQNITVEEFFKSKVDVQKSQSR